MKFSLNDNFSIVSAQNYQLIQKQFVKCLLYFLI